MNRKRLNRIPFPNPDDVFDGLLSRRGIQRLHL